MSVPQECGETQVGLQSGNDTLYGVLYAPRSALDMGLILCHPLFEERKSAHRPIVETARALANAGFAALQFDYRGCGDSDGDFASYSTPDWTHDIAAAASWLRDRHGCRRIGLLGLRAGASLCVSAARESGADLLVLWEPMPDGTVYLHAELRKKLMKEMVTFGQNRTTREELLDQLRNGTSVDFDGYELTPTLHADLGSLNLLEHDAPPCPTLIVSVSAKETGSPEARKLAIHYGDAAELRAIRARPFWNLIGHTDCSALTATTLRWLQTLQPGVES